MNLQSLKITTGKSAAELYHFLYDVKNFEKIMPENISKFEVLEDNAFIFALKGMPEIALQLVDGVPHSKVVLGSMSEKIPFTLTAKIDELQSGKTDVQLFFEGEFNMMMAMMIKGPIGKFLETLSENLKTLQ